MSSSFPSSAAISSACRALGIKAPPTSKRVLKQRFIELAKKNHPDRVMASQLMTAKRETATDAGSSSLSSADQAEERRRQFAVDVATRTMAELTEAYKTLEKLYDARERQQRGRASENGNGVGGAAAAAAGPDGMPPFGAVHIDFEAERATPEAKLRREVSMERTWLPWLKKPREEVDGARPLAAHSRPLTVMYLLEALCPNSVRVACVTAFHFVRLRASRLARSVKFIVTGK